MTPLEYKKHPTPGKCAVKFCGNNAKGELCSTCRCRKSRLADPVRYSYYNIKNRAKQRKKPFTITLEYFRKWCKKVNYIGMKGRGKGSYDCDCKINNLGYVPGNIQPLEKIKNIKKYFYYDYRTKQVMIQRAEPVTEDGPF